MKLTIEVDCTPEEARSFLGLPDVQALNAQLVEDVQARLTSNMAKLSPDELLKSWANLGVSVQEQLRKVMSAAVELGNRSGTT